MHTLGKELWKLMVIGFKQLGSPIGRGKEILCHFQYAA